MPRRAAGLSAAKVTKAAPGRYGDGAGLYLLVRSAEARFWVFRWTRAGRMREMGLGPAAGRAAVSLAEARTKARRLHDMVREGRDPLAERDAEQAAAKSEAAQTAASVITFRVVADRYLGAHEAGWKNPKHRQQWRNTLRDYVLPAIGDLAVAAVGTGDVMGIVEPLWQAKPETASRVRGRIESVLDYAAAREWRTGENPARWRGHLDHLLPARAKVQRVEHHAALPWRGIGAFMDKLGRQQGVAALALRFAILTAARSGEVRGAAWGEIDLDNGLWTIPAERMKAAREHRVPLSDAALGVLRQMRLLRDPHHGDLVFPGGRLGRPLSDVAVSKAAKVAGGDDATVHGFRSTFRDWCAEATGYPREVAESALAHVVRDKTEAAYQRGDFFDKRRKLMAEWATFCGRVAAPAGDVVPLRAVSRA
jgi:integrase